MRCAHVLDGRIYKAYKTITILYFRGYVASAKEQYKFIIYIPDNAMLMFYERQCTILRETHTHCDVPTFRWQKYFNSDAKRLQNRYVYTRKPVSERLQNKLLIGQ